MVDLEDGDWEVKEEYGKEFEDFWVSSVRIVFDSDET